MSDYDRKNAELYANELRPFVGRKVTGVAVDRELGCVGLEFGQSTVWFLSDEEGNAPGFPCVENGH